MSGLEKGRIQPEPYKFEWKIERFFADCEKVGDFYQSPEFPIQYPNNKTKWFLKMYPKGEKEESKDYVAINLWSLSESEINVTVTFQVSIVNDQKPSLLFKTTTTFKGYLFGWGWRRFRKQDCIKDAKNKALVNDTLTVLCEVKFCGPGECGADDFHDYHNYIDIIGDRFGDYEEILESGDFSDVTFNVQDKQINSHKAILSCQSPVFKAMFKHDMKENKQNTVDIIDIDYDVMMELFRFLYSGIVQNIENIASDLLIAADKYQVIELKALCEKSLYDSITVNNAIEYLKLTGICDTIHLRKLCIKFVAAHYKEIVKKPAFIELNRSTMQQIILAIAEIN